MTNTVLQRGQLGFSGRRELPHRRRPVRLVQAGEQVHDVVPADAISQCGRGGACELLAKLRANGHRA